MYVRFQGKVPNNTSASNPTLLSKLLICCALALTAGCASVEAKDRQADSLNQEDIRFQGKFPGSWIKQLMFAYDDFQTTGQDSDCFTVYLLRRGSEYELGFQPNPEIETVGDRTRTTTGRNSCGYGVNYRFDSSGRFPTHRNAPLEPVTRKTLISWQGAR